MLGAKECGNVVEGKWDEAGGGLSISYVHVIH